ncbi:hypothetical protein Y1Q_0013693 [Alligator mississippiensis]|uniref:Uncharacterized protein n=1 Tax=Alligator mississippiensis TaxID=8496 RepID=A0A151P3R4_ALLMI|nr:hypothetical protein Y1Q_0013693 [Alligator mississippiensis]
MGEDKPRGPPPLPTRPPSAECTDATLLSFQPVLSRVSAPRPTPRGKGHQLPPDWRRRLSVTAEKDLLSPARLGTAAAQVKSWRACLTLKGGPSLSSRELD